MYPPSPSNLSEDIPKLRRIASNCAPSLVLTTRLYLARVVRPSSLLLLHRWPAVRAGWRTTDDLPVRSFLETSRLYDQPCSTALFAPLPPFPLTPFPTSLSSPTSPNPGNS